MENKYPGVNPQTFVILNNGRCIFEGAINNLPEFKLILKMLNIE